MRDEEEITDYNLETLQNMVLNSKEQIEKNPVEITKIKDETTSIQRKYNIMKKHGFKVIMPRFKYEESDDWTKLLEDLAEKEYTASMVELKGHIEKREEHQKVLEDQYKHWKRLLRKKEKEVKTKQDYVG